MSHRRQVEIVVSLGVLIVVASVAPLVAQPYTFTHLAGSTVSADAIDATGAAARFNTPEGVAADSAGNVFVADSFNHTIRKITPSGVVTTFAGVAGACGSTNGPDSVARFCYPTGLVFDASGNLFVADYTNNAIRKITPAGIVSTFAGTPGTSGSADGTGTAAKFANPYGITIDSAGNLYVADYTNNNIRKITAAGVVTTLAGTAGVAGSADGTGPAAQFASPMGIAVDGSGNVFVGDTQYPYCQCIREITPGGVVTKLPAGVSETAYGLAIDGSGTLFVANGGFVDSITKAQYNLSSPYSSTTLSSDFNQLSALALDGSGNVYVTDKGRHNVRKITPANVVSTLAGGTPTSGYVDGTGSAATFNGPYGVAVDSGGTLYVSDYYAYTIRKITAAGAVTTLAGKSFAWGNTDGTGSVARFNYPVGIAADNSGNVYVADSVNKTIRKITSGGAVTTLAGSGVTGYADGTGTAAQFSNPIGAAIDSSGNIYVSDMFMYTIRKVTSGGVVTTFAGAPLTGGGTANGTGSAARFYFPAGTAVDGSGNVYVADNGNDMIRKITPGGVVTTLAGTPGDYFADGTGAAARFAAPYGVAADAAGNVYVADTGNSVIRKVTPAGVVTTIGGGVTYTSTGIDIAFGNNDGTGTAALFTNPHGIAVDAAGTLYIADTDNNCIRKGVPAIADTATIDSSSGQPGTMRLLGVSPNTASTWLWEEIRRPSASAATLSSTSIPNPSFTPDIAGLYVFRLTASSSTGSRVSTVSLSAGLSISGDINGDKVVDVRDVFYLVNNLFAGGAAPVGSADVNGDGKVNAADVIYLIRYLFAGGTAPH